MGELEIPLLSMSCACWLTLFQRVREVRRREEELLGWLNGEEEGVDVKLQKLSNTMARSYYKVLAIKVNLLLFLPSLPPSFPPSIFISSSSSFSSAVST